MKPIFFILLLTITTTSNSQIIQQVNTYSQFTGEVVKLNSVEDQKAKKIDTLSIPTARLLKGDSDIDKLSARNDTIKKVPNDKKDENIKKINGTIENINSQIENLKAEQANLISKSKSDPDYKYRIKMLEQQNEYIEKEKQRLQEHIISTASTNVLLKDALVQVTKELKENNEKNNTRINKLMSEKLSLIRNDYSQFAENADYRIKTNAIDTKNISDTIAARAKNINEMDELLLNLPHNKEVKNAAKLINTLATLSDSLQAKAKRSIELQEISTKAFKDYKAYEFALLSVIDSSTFEPFIGKYVIPAQETINNTIKIAAKSIISLQEDLKSLNSNINDWAIKINDVVERFKPKSENKPQDFTVLGGFNKMLNERGALIPAVTILGNRFFGKPGEVGNAFGQIKLFMGGTGDNVPPNTSYNFFVPGASTYGLSVNVGYGFTQFNQKQKESRKMGSDERSGGLFFAVSYLSKRLKPNDSTTIDPGVLHWKTGAEWIIFPNNILSLHSNINGIFIGAQYEKVKANYTISKDVNWFIDAGLSTYLELAEDKKLYLKLDLDFIITTSDMKAFIKTTDKFIPQFKMEIVKNF